MRVLLIGDIVGLPGCRAVAELLPGIIADYKIDSVIANAENAAGGFGLTQTLARELFACGVDLLTSGNHIWDKRNIVKYIDQDTRLLRPANFPEGTPGRGSALIASGGQALIGVLNLAGRVFMDSLDCPFRTAQREIALLREKTPVIIVDMHAEATAEKIAMGWFLDGSVSAVLGTHTHVQTADEKILPQGTAYITDAGMTGAADSVIGIRKEQALKRFLTQMPAHFAPAENDVQLHGVWIELDPASGKSLRIERVQRACVPREEL
jgi:metallophosphoesterase (TIGR00282 family)